MRTILMVGVLLVALPMLLLSLVMVQVASIEQSGVVGSTALPVLACTQQCQGNQAIAQAALTIAHHVYGSPGVWYDAGMPATVTRFWGQACPAGSGCWTDWQEGNLQCVMLVTGTFALAGHPLPVAGNAFDFWGLYQDRAGWTRIPAGAAPVGQRQPPDPGDIMVWWDPPPAVGHVAIVTAVTLPHAGQAGAVTFAEANGPGSLVTEPLLPDLSVQTWPGYLVYGYIRLQSTHHAGATHPVKHTKGKGTHR